MVNERGLKTDDGKRFKWAIRMPRATEAQAQQVASKLNSHVQSCAKVGRRYRVLNEYPSGILRVVFC
jgi:hypothetical protein